MEVESENNLKKVQHPLNSDPVRWAFSTHGLVLAPQPVLPSGLIFAAVTPYLVCLVCLVVTKHLVNPILRGADR